MINLQSAKRFLINNIKESILTAFNNSSEENLEKFFSSNGFVFFETETCIGDFNLKIFQQSNSLMGGAILMSTNSKDFVFVSEININTERSMFAFSNNDILETEILSIINNEHVFLQSSVYNDFNQFIFTDTNRLNIGTKAQRLLFIQQIVNLNGRAEISLNNKMKDLIKKFVLSTRYFSFNTNVLSTELIVDQYYGKFLRKILRNKLFTSYLKETGYRGFDIIKRTYEEVTTREINLLRERNRDVDTTDLPF